MTLKDLLKKKDKIENDEHSQPASATYETPEFTFMRSDTNTQELISPPTFADDAPPPRQPTSHSRQTSEDQRNNKRFSRFRSSSNASTASHVSAKSERRFSQVLHRRSGSHTSRDASVNIPPDLPNIQDVAVNSEDKQAQWEERATILAKSAVSHQADNNPHTEQKRHSRSGAPAPSPDEDTRVVHSGHLGDQSKILRRISDAQGDENIQAAIRLHEAGNLEQSTAMFGRLADHNAMAQIMYGLALRHGWGIEPDATLAISYLSQAASNSANVESDALNAGMKKGGAAKGELVLAIYELANSFRHGWGVERDAVAARNYYECAANLGDTDAMNEVARCYEEGLGTKKDKYTAAQYYRLAEKSGSKTLGNSWIWKDKYNPKEK